MLMNAGKMPDDILEGMACEGGCVAGPRRCGNAAEAAARPHQS